MATLDTRPYSKNYSGLETQTILAFFIGGLCLSSFELMRHKRRMTKAHKAAVQSGTPEAGLGSVESWEWGYLYQGRCWAKRPSPPLPKLPLAWVKQMIILREADLLPLVGPDTTVYARFMRGTWYFTLIHTFTTLIILLPIHLVFAPKDIPKTSITRASLTSLVASDSGKKLLVIHLLLLAWVSLTWIANLFWICRGAFRYRRRAIKQAAQRVQSDEEKARDHPVPGVDEETRRQLRGWRLKTVMVTNVPAPLRDDKLLKQYFDFYLARVKAEPPAAPGLIAGVVAFFHRFAQARAAKDVEEDTHRFDEEAGGASPITAEGKGRPEESKKFESAHAIEKVVVVRKMTELASLLARRDDAMRKLEEAHVKLARKTLAAVKKWLEQKRKGTKSTARFLRRMSQKEVAARVASVKNQQRKHSGNDAHHATHSDNVVEEAKGIEGPTEEEEQRMMDSLTDALQPYLEEFGMMPKSEHPALPHKGPFASTWIYRKFKGNGLHSPNSNNGDAAPVSDTYPPGTTNAAPNVGSVPSAADKPSIWEVLHALPRHDLDAFQPLIRLNSLFRGATVPAIDYYSTKLGLLTALINESRSRPATSYIPASTAFVTFRDAEDALRAIRLIPSHPKNPLVCLVSAAPELGDLDWSRLMTKTYTGEFLKDWVVDIGVWAFTCLWIIPVSLFVSLVSINTLSSVWPGLGDYLAKHPIKQEIISSLLPTLLVTGLSILVPLILLLIAKKAHNIVLLSKLHDQIMTRYHKFLVCNVLIFFCVGVSALQTFLASFKQPTNPLPIVAQKFPDAAPFYIGWLIFQTALHAGLELGLLGLPLIVYPSTVLKAITPRRRKAGMRPRTFNFYYWLPNHLIVLFIVFCFAILNPLVIPFAFIYFSVAFVMFRHQFLHVYSKAYEMNATVLLVRMVRYSLDGIALAQFIFLALTIILEEKVLAGFSGVFIVLTIGLKLYITTYIRANFAIDAVTEAKAICGSNSTNSTLPAPEPAGDTQAQPLSPAHTDGTIEDERLLPSDSPAHHRSRLDGLFHPHLHRRHHSDHLNSSDHHGPVRFWTWKLPSGATQFAYSTLPPRPARPARHGPIPFGPPEASQVDSKTPARSQSETNQPSADPGVFQLGNPPAAVYEDAFTSATKHNGSMVDLYNTRSHGLVQAHEGRKPWDDAPRYDLTYDNPHYTRPIDNVLWLPINPCTILDLDETVSVFRAITSEPGAGALGQWVNESTSIMAEPPETARMPELIEGDDAPPAGDDEEIHELALMGNERIDLRPAIESRVEAIENEKDVQQSEGASSYFGITRPPTRRKSSSISMTSTQAGQGRSFSGATMASTQGAAGRTLRPTLSRLSGRNQPLPSPTSPKVPASVGMGLPSQSPITPRATYRVTSGRSRMRSGSIAGSQYSTGTFDPISHVDLGSQTPFADPNFNILLRSPSRFVDESPENETPKKLGGSSPATFATPGPSGAVAVSGATTGEQRANQLNVPGGGTGSRTATGRARSNSRFSVTTREAVVGEVLAEEQIAATERVKKETEESEQAGAPRSFLTSWLYHTLHHDEE